MKARMGFVSNSSSSSFVLVGIQATDEIMQFYYDNDSLPEEFKIDGLDYLGDDGPGWIGDILFDSDCGESPESISIEYINSIKEKFPEKYRDQVKVYYGTRSC